MEMTTNKQKLKDQLIQKYLVEEATERTENMENLINYALRSFTLRCESLLDRIPPQIRTMSMKSFIATYGANGLQKCLRMEEGGMGERRRTVMQAVREVRRTTQAAAKRMHNEMSSESEAERGAKRSRNMRRSTRQRQDSDDESFYSARESLSHPFSTLLPETPHITHIKPKKKTEDAPLVGVNLFESTVPQAAQFTFDPSSILANNTLDPKRKKEVEQHLKKMQEEYAKIKKALEGPNKTNLAAVKAKVDTGRKK